MYFKCFLKEDEDIEYEYTDMTLCVCVYADKCVHIGEHMVFCMVGLYFFL